MGQLAAGRIRHTVVFTLSHPEGSAEEAEFLATAARLAAIPGVRGFRFTVRAGRGRPSAWVTSGRRAEC